MPRYGLPFGGGRRNTHTDLPGGTRTRGRSDSAGRGRRRRGVGLVMLIFRRDVVSRRKGRGEVVHHVRGSLAVDIRDGRDRGDHLGLGGHIGLGGSSTLPLSGRHSFLRSSRDGGTLSDCSGGLGLLGVDVALTLALMVDRCGARLRVGSLRGRSHGSRGSGGELVRSNGESAVLGLRSGNRSGGGLAVGAIPIRSALDMPAHVSGRNKSSRGSSRTALSTPNPPESGSCPPPFVPAAGAWSW